MMSSLKLSPRRVALVAVSALALAVGGLVAGPTYAAAPANHGLYTQAAEFNAPSATSNSWFGFAVAMSRDGKTAAVGAPMADQTKGAVYVYTLSSGQWTQTAELTASDGAQQDGLGRTVAISRDGHTVVAGSPVHNAEAGAAYVYTDSGGTWSQAQELTAADGQANDLFGFAVAVSADGSTVLVGAPATQYDQGSLYVFTGDSGTWTQSAELTVPGQQGLLGNSVALSDNGRVAVAGAPYLNTTPTAYVFSANKAGAWRQRAALTPSDGVVGDEFGDAVSVSAKGSTILVGSMLHNGETGAAYVYSKAGKTWTQSAELTASDGSGIDKFGTSVALSTNGKLAVVGAPDTGDAVGAVYVFADDGEAWSQSSEIADPDGATYDLFGQAVATSGKGTTLLVGAWGHQLAGSAYVFTQ